MENTHKFSKIEITLRVLLFLIFACSAIFKLIVGFENFEMNLMESNTVDSWIQTIYITSLVAILEISCAILALFGKFSWFQNAIFTTTFVFYFISILISASTPLYQDYTLIFFGFDIYGTSDIYFFGGYFLNILLLLISIALVVLMQKKGGKSLIKWPFQLTLTIVFSITYLLFGAIKTKQFKLKTEQYQAGITNWTDFNTAVTNQYPSFHEGKWTVAFFSTSCDHCKKYARKISMTPGGRKNVLYVFWAEEDDIEKFKTENNVDGPHMRLPQHVIMNIAGQEYPVFFSFEDGIPITNYTGKEFSYAAIDNAFGN